MTSAGRAAGDAVFSPYLSRWRLTRDGSAVKTRSSRLLPVRTGSGEAAILKIAFEAEERHGAALMIWWAGQGAARVLAHDGDALLLERAEGPDALDVMAREGRDDEATRILCHAAAALHSAPGARPAGLVPLDLWFSGLWPAAERHGGPLVRSADIARDLLVSPRDIVPLHGDIHHGNVLDFGPRGWLAIDPKGLMGERGFDYANIVCNPDRATALAEGRLARQASIIAQESVLERTRVLKWIVAWSGLSAAWRLEDGETEEVDLTMVEIAAAELDR